MSSLPMQIMSQAVCSPEGVPLCPSALLHLGSRAAIYQALSRLACSGRLLRVCQGVYVVPIQTRFGLRPPALEKVIVSLSRHWGETIVPCGGLAANALGLTTQVPVRTVYLTSGRNRKLTFGELTVELRQAPRWQLTAPNRPAGEAVRAMSWLGPREVEASLEVIKGKFSTEDLQELAALNRFMPAWIAGPLSTLATNG